MASFNMVILRMDGSVTFFNLECVANAYNPFIQISGLDGFSVLFFKDFMGVENYENTLFFFIFIYLFLFF